MMKNILLLVYISIFAYGWDGYDYQSNSYVEIEKGNLVRSGRDIEIYDYKDGTYKNVEVQSIQKIGNSIEVEVYDYNKGEYRTLDMDDK